MFSVLCLIFRYVSVSRTILSVQFDCYVLVTCTILSVFCLIVCYVSVSRTILFVFCFIVCYVSVMRTIPSVLFDCLLR